MREAKKPTDSEIEDRKFDYEYRQRIHRAKTNLLGRIPKKDLKPVELWEKDKTSWQKFKIELTIIWRRFMTQTHGMGFVLVIMMIVFIAVMIIPFIASGIMAHIDSTKYKTALENECTDKTFYAWNFKACENIGARPTQ